MNARSTIGLELMGILCVLALTCFRLWIQRGRERTAAGWAYDTCLFLALICYVFISTVDLWSSSKEISFRRRVPNPTQKQLSGNLQTREFMKIFFAGGVSYTCFLWFVKGSFVALYFEMKAHFPRRIMISLYVVTAFIVITFITNILLKLLWCLPLSRSWTIGPHSCTFAVALPVNTCTAFFNIATDISLLALFGSIVYALQFKQREMVAAVFIGVVGTLTAVAAALRYAIAYTAFKDSKASWRNAKTVLLWTNVEMGLVMLAVSLPAFRIYLRRKGNQSSQYSHTTSGQHGETYLNKSLSKNRTVVGTELMAIDNMKGGSDERLVEQVK